MAPEVANAQYKQDYASPASDLFSLGVGCASTNKTMYNLFWMCLLKSDTQVIVYMLVSGGREPFWDGSDIRAIKNTLKKEVAINSPSLKFCTKVINECFINLSQGELCTS